ncbi:MAG: SulP family inorganic anion transporter, partial [Acidimicrobiia bacterium]|nr:SulP family inorganic anion transporter [Acidimicrobiia bacterium]
MTQDPSMPTDQRRFGAADVIAGLSVALVVVPQSLAYAEIAGMPPYTGLYAAALPSIAAAPLSASRYLQTGPVAMTALLTFGALSAIAEPGTTDYIGLAMLLALMVGVIRLILGLIKGGMITNYMSPAVILGFTSAAAALIIASQSATIFGVVDAKDDLVARFVDALSRVGDWNWEAIGIAAGTAAIMLAGRRVNKLFPGVLVAVIIGVVVAALTGYSGELVGEVPEGFPPLSLALPWSRAADLAVPALIIAMVGFAEPTAIARTMALQDRERWDADRELISQGVANIASGISGGFPVGGSFARSSINRLAGAKTRWSGAVTGLAVVAFMPFAGVLSELPKAVLGAIVVVAVSGLLKIPEMIRLLRVSWGQSFVAWVTAVATILLSPRVDLAIIVG